MVPIKVKEAQASSIRVGHKQWMTEKQVKVSVRERRAQINKTFTSARFVLQ